MRLRIEALRLFLPAGTKNTRDTCRAAICAMHQ